MAEEGVLPRQFGVVHEGRRRPWVAIAFTIVDICALVLRRDVNFLALRRESAAGSAAP